MKTRLFLLAAAAVLLGCGPAESGETAGAGPSLGSYECWHYSTPLLGLQFTLEKGGDYLDSEGEEGGWSFDAGAGTISFEDGALDGQTVLYEALTPPQVTFKTGDGTYFQGDFCQLTQ
jgi:hypothetical protein